MSKVRHKAYFCPFLNKPVVIAIATFLAQRIYSEYFRCTHFNINCFLNFDVAEQLDHFSVYWYLDGFWAIHHLALMNWRISSFFCCCWWMDFCFFGLNWTASTFQMFKEFNLVLTFHRMIISTDTMARLHKLFERMSNDSVAFVECKERGISLNALA